MALEGSARLWSFLKGSVRLWKTMEGSEWLSRALEASAASEDSGRLLRALKSSGGL